MIELELSGKAPLSKKEIEDLSYELIAPVINGEIDPVAHVVRLKAIHEAIKKALDDDRLKDVTLSEIEKFGRSRSWNGATVTIKETGVRYDYSVCCDPVYNDLLSKKKEVENSIKARESFLKVVEDNTSILDEETGEISVLHPAVRMASVGYSISFNK